MALPTVRKSYDFDLNNSITYTSLNGVMAALLFEAKESAKAKGWTVAGSSDGTTGGMDAVDRWTDATKTTTRGANASSPQSWIILVDANGMRSLWAYQGSTDDVMRTSFADSAFTIAATATHQPTHAGEQILGSANSVIGTETSGNRVWHGWFDQADKGYRICVARANVTKSAWWVEETDKDDVAGNVTWNGSWGGFSTGSAGAMSSMTNLFGFTAASNAKRARPTVSGTPINAQCFFGAEIYNNAPNTFQNVLVEMQGGSNYPLVALKLASNTTGGQGKYGALYDWWMGRNSGTDGDTYGTLQFVAVSAACGLVWPWDGATATQWS